MCRNLLAVGVLADRASIGNSAGNIGLWERERERERERETTAPATIVCATKRAHLVVGR